MTVVIMKWTEGFFILTVCFLSIVTGEVTIGNFEVESPEDGVPSLDTGMYLMSQEIPFDGHIEALNACAFLTEPNPNPRDANQLTLYFFVAGYRLIGNNFKRITGSLQFFINIERTHTFGCTLRNLTSQEKPFARVLKGDRSGVFVDQRDCRPFSIIGQPVYFCPAHVNIIDPVENCSQSLYFNSTRLEGDNMDQVPAELNAVDGNPVNVFINLNTVVEPNSPPNAQASLEQVCATQFNVTRTSSRPNNNLAIALSLIAGGVIFIGTVIIGVVFFVYCRRWKENKKLQEEISYHDTLESDPNVRPQSNAQYHQPDASNSQLGASLSFRNRMHSVQNEYSTSIASSQRVHYIVRNEIQTHDDDTDQYEVDRALEVELEAEYEYADVEDFWEPANRETMLKEQLGSLNIKEIPINNLEIKEQVGSGQFATVYHAVWRREDDEAKDVAVKCLKDGASEEQKMWFLREAAIMGQFEHPNILQILAIAYNEEMKPNLIVDLMHIGDLRCHLLSLRPRNSDQVPHELSPTLLSYSRQVAFGMHYLSCKKFVHRDLAARNVLVANDGTCKIADFGLSRDLQHEEYYVSQGGKVPVKWTAPESLHYRRYSTASDVWSYGCLLYEIWSLGCKPFSKSNNIEALKQIATGYRLPPPPGCPKAIYDTMIKCWNPKPELRPPFMKIVVALQQPDFKLLSWSPKDTCSLSENAKYLGAPLAEGACLYKTLQRAYIKKSDCEATTEPKVEQITNNGEALKDIHTGVSYQHNLDTPDSPLLVASKLNLTL